MVNEKTTWVVQCIVNKVDRQAGTLTLWIDCFDDIQEVSIESSMPDWIFKKDVMFTVVIPRICVREHSLVGVTWSNFTQLEDFIDDDDVTTEMWEELWNDRFMNGAGVIKND